MVIGKRWGALAALGAAALLTACATPPPAPWEDRSAPRPEEPRITPPRVVPAPDAHRVERGDSLYSIAFRYRLDWRNLAAWNRIAPPYVIRPGQWIRLSAPADRPVVAEHRPEPAPAPEARREPAVRPVPESVPVPEPEPETEPEPVRADPAPAEPSRAPAPIAEAVERNVAGVNWRWPTEGRVTRRFDAGDTRKGIHIAGQAGQPVTAAADGQIVYSGTGLIGYGELIIVKHSDSMLSAYGHNNRRLVNEGERVRAGQQIAELGINERNEQILHFEIRRNGQPEDPLRFLPAR